jgi:hypothetical protein
MAGRIESRMESGQLGDDIEEVAAGLLTRQ